MRKTLGQAPESPFGPPRPIPFLSRDTREEPCPSPAIRQIYRKASRSIIGRHFRKLRKRGEPKRVTPGWRPGGRHRYGRSGQRRRHRASPPSAWHPTRPPTLPPVTARGERLATPMTRLPTDVTAQRGDGRTPQAGPGTGQLISTTTAGPRRDTTTRMPRPPRATMPVGTGARARFPPTQGCSEERRDGRGPAPCAQSISAAHFQPASTSPSTHEIRWSAFAAIAALPLLSATCLAHSAIRIAITSRISG